MRARVLVAKVMVRMSPEMLDAVKRDADEHGRTVAQTIRLAIGRYLGVEAEVLQ